MSSRAEKEHTEQALTSQGGAQPPLLRPGTNEAPLDEVTLGLGSRSPRAEEGHEPTTLPQRRGLLPVPAAVEAEITRQEAEHPMTPGYRKALRDRLTLEHYFSDVEVAFRRTQIGIEVLAAGLDQIAEFRRTSRPEERQGVVYGVG
jgi:hypothetical protein